MVSPDYPPRRSLLAADSVQHRVRPRCLVLLKEEEHSWTPRQKTSGALEPRSLGNPNSID